MKNSATAPSARMPMPNSQTVTAATIGSDGRPASKDRDSPSQAAMPATPNPKKWMTLSYGRRGASTAL